MVSQDPAQRVRANVGPGGRSLREILLDQTDAGRALRWLTTKATEPRSLVLGFALAFVAFAIYWFVNNDRRASLDYYVPLANAFLHGRLGFEVEPPSGGYNKLVPFGGQLFVVYPPMPAVVLMPFVLLFGEGIDQARVAILFGALNVALAMWVALGVAAPAVDPPSSWQSSSVSGRLRGTRTGGDVVAHRSRHGTHVRACRDRPRGAEPATLADRPARRRHGSMPASHVAGRTVLPCVHRSTWPRDPTPDRQRSEPPRGRAICASVPVGAPPDGRRSAIRALPGCSARPSISFTTPRGSGARSRQAMP